MSVNSRHTRTYRRRACVHSSYLEGMIMEGKLRQASPRGVEACPPGRYISGMPRRVLLVRGDWFKQHDSYACTLQAASYARLS